METIGFFIMILGLFVVVPILTSYLMRLPAAKIRYQKVDDRKLVEENVRARMMRKRTFEAALLAPVPLLLQLFIIRAPSMTKPFLYVTILVLFGALSARRMFWEIERITTSELEYRSFQKRGGKDAAQEGTQTDGPSARYSAATLGI